MLDLIPGLLSGLLSGGVIGWVVGHHFANSAKQAAADGGPFKAVQPETVEQARIEGVTRKIRSLTLSVAADVSAHQSKVAHITTDLEASASQCHTDAIVATVAELVAANKAMHTRLEESQKQIREQSKQLHTTQQLANTDALTGLSNRRVFDSELAKVSDVPGAQRGTLALIDIDHFKSVNDQYGHPTGDLVLCRLAELLDANLGEACLCSRFGGEEFAVYCHSADWNMVADLIEKTRIQLSGMRLIPEAPNRSLTFSCGLALHMGQESNDEWLARVDSALYAAKHDNRNNLQVHNGRSSKRYSPAPEPVSNVRVSSASTPSPIQSDGNAGAEHATENRKSLVSQLRTMVDNIDLDRVNVAAVAIRLPESDYAIEDHQTLLQQTRSLLRSVDRIGFDDQRTLLALMVTSDLRRTEERASQLLEAVNQVLSEVLNDNAASSETATMGIGLLDNDSSAEEVIAKAVKRAAANVAHSR